MDAHELRARTAWGLIADPADTLAWRLQREFGPIEALGQVLGSHNIRALSKRLSATLTDGEVSLESLRTYRSRYSPNRVLQRGAMVSEVPATVAPTIVGLLARNRVVAALADGVVAVQAEYRSGAISVAYHAAALGRHVGVVPGPWNDTRSAGCWRIYRECGAIVLTEPADLSLVIPGVTHPSTS